MSPNYLSLDLVLNLGQNEATSTCYTLQDAKNKKLRASRYESAHTPLYDRPVTMELHLQTTRYSYNVNRFFKLRICALKKVEFFSGKSPDRSGHQHK